MFILLVDVMELLDDVLYYDILVNLLFELLVLFVCFSWLIEIVGDDDVDCVVVCDCFCFYCDCGYLI